jgi:6-phosphofructo-2-kinase/fructose-2,6-biphosphatase 4
LKHTVLTCRRSRTLQYKGWDADRAVEDYWLRIKQQEKHYEEVTTDEGPFIKIINVGERIVVNRIEGGLYDAFCSDAIFY